MTAVRTSPFPTSTVLGYPRIGPRRELKWALEAYWDGRCPARTSRRGTGLRATTWRRLEAPGLAAVPSNTFSYYDHVLDTAMLVGAVPERYRERPRGWTPTSRWPAAEGSRRCEMTKWFDTNYHYLVPEIGPTTVSGSPTTSRCASYCEARGWA